jgi:hypothetical protein
VTSVHGLPDPTRGAALLRPSFTYTDLLERGATAIEAYTQVVRELSRARHRKLVADLGAYPSGRAALQRAAQEWDDRGWPPPWAVSAHP